MTLAFSLRLISSDCLFSIHTTVSHLFPSEPPAFELRGGGRDILKWICIENDIAVSHISGVGEYYRAIRDGLGDTIILLICTFFCQTLYQLLEKKTIVKAALNMNNYRRFSMKSVEVWYGVLNFLLYIGTLVRHWCGNVSLIFQFKLFQAKVSLSSSSTLLYFSLPPFPFSIQMNMSLVFIIKLAESR